MTTALTPPAHGVPGRSGRLHPAAGWERGSDVLWQPAARDRRAGPAGRARLHRRRRRRIGRTRRADQPATRGRGRQPADLDRAGYRPALRPAGAALCNGLAAHSQDFDDSNPWAQGHTSVSVLSAALALAEELGSSGMELLTAYVAGVDVASRIGVATGPGADRHGFHLTGITGAFGAAAACGRLLGLDIDGLQGALGLAATAASGIKGVFGTQGKHLNAARASVEGMLAARLVERGFTAPDEAITGASGYCAGFTDTWDVARIDERMGCRNGMEDVVFKFYACCHGTHSTIEGISRLRRERPFGVGEVEQVVLRIPPVLRQICTVNRPTTGLASKFSLQYVAALALAGRDPGPAAFTDEAVADPVIAGLIDRVELVNGEATLAARAPTDVLVELTSGERLSVSVSAVDPAPDNQLPGQRTRLEQKFAALAGPVIGESQAAELAAAVACLDEMPTVAAVLRLAATGRMAS